MKKIIFFVTAFMIFNTHSNDNSLPRNAQFYYFGKRCFRVCFTQNGQKHWYTTGEENDKYTTDLKKESEEQRKQRLTLMAAGGQMRKRNKLARKIVRQNRK